MNTRIMTSVLTIGHSNHELAKFLRFLASAGITTVIHVRSRPRSGMPPTSIVRLLNRLSSNVAWPTCSWAMPLAGCLLTLASMIQRASSFTLR